MARSNIPDWQRQAARRPRREMTDAEQKLWQALRAHRFHGFAFRRQAPIGPYIADFVCHQLKLVVEADGGLHPGSDRDAERDAWLAREGYRVLRFWNNDLLENLEEVLDRIGSEIAAAPPPRPSPARGEGDSAAPETTGAPHMPPQSTAPPPPAWGRAGEGGQNTRDLARLFRPKSIAVFGGGAWGPNVIEQCRKMGFDGQVWPVHPTRDEIHGLRCFRTVEELPEAPDASFIGVNRDLTVEIVERLARRGAGGAVCFASGFKESQGEIDGGADLQARLLEAAGDMPILGPNCYGFINYLDGALLWPDQHGGRRVGSGVAILTQSSNILINMTMQTRGLPVAYCVAAGNQAQTGLAEMAMAVMDDPRVTAVGLHIEGVGDVRAFEALAAKARAMRKPVVALKVGRSDQARAGTVSHTASLAGSEAASRAVLTRLNMPMLRSIPEFLETLKLLHVHGPLPGRNLCSMSCSGGEASLIADAAVGRNLTFRPLSAAERGAVKATLGAIVTVANPLDYHTFIWDDEPALTATFTAMVGCGFDLSMLVLDFPRLDRCSDASWDSAVRAIASARKATGGRVAVVATMPENMPEARSEQLISLGLAPLLGLDEALAAAEAAAAIAEGWKTPAPAPVMLGVGADAKAHTLDEAAAKAALAGHGLPVPEGAIATTPQGAAAIAGEIGFPVVLKGRGIAHKTEAGAIRLGLRSAEAVAAAARSMDFAESWLVERMVEGAVAELILGVVRDPVYGYTLTIGAGGILTELLADCATMMIPATEAEIRAALAGLKTAALLTGYRGRAHGNLDAVVSACMALQAYVAEIDDRLEELDINPLMVTPHGAVAADALIRLRESKDD
jgi:acyl-CoA synthetase (NDP forming)/very-short-patch-repair endonuclease